MNKNSQGLRVPALIVVFSLIFSFARPLNVYAGFFLPKNIETEMYPFMMEALNNSLKHAHARHVSVSFVVEPGGVWIRIQDDGVGFNPAADHSGGMGLKNMRDRCNRVGALYRLTSQPGEGTRVEVFLPRSNMDH